MEEMIEELQILDKKKICKNSRTWCWTCKCRQLEEETNETENW